MPGFAYQTGILHAQDLPLTSIAEQIGTPCFVYSRQIIENRWQTLNQAFTNHPHLLCYAVKANSNIAVLNILARLGSGFDIVSGGELRRVLAAGGDPQKTVFSGLGKREDEIRLAIKHAIRSINIESVPELERVQQIACAENKIANIAFRVNPDVDAHTHPYIATGLKQSKFGIDFDMAVSAYEKAANMSHINIHGLACHIGSQIHQPQPFVDSIARLAELLTQLEAKKIAIRELDLGGGLAVGYGESTPCSAEQYAHAVIGALTEHGIKLPITLEPGRYISAEAGVLLTRIEYIKDAHTVGAPNFIIVDAGLSELLRPALYQARHPIKPVQQKESTTRDFVVVGPICESSDSFGLHPLPTPQAGDLLAIMDAGAYGFVMASNYNTRVRPAEVMVDTKRLHIIRQRETMDDLLHHESLLP